MITLKNVGIFLQVRINSSRMPGKSLLPLHGKLLVEQAMERLNVIPADVRVLVTSYESYSVLRDCARKMNWEIYAGPTQNVLERFVMAARFYKVDTIVRATADNPLVSSEIARVSIDLYSQGICDLLYLKPIPYGSGVEIIRTEALVTALASTSIPYDLEHVTPYIYAHRDQFKIREGRFHDSTVEREDVRITVDTREDYEKINHLFRLLKKSSISYKIKSIVSTWDSADFSHFRRLLFVINCGGSYGIGHLTRCMLLAGKLEKNFDVYFTVKEGDPYYLKNYPYKVIPFEEIGTFTEKEGVFDRVIADVRDTTCEEMVAIEALGPVISIDDAGTGGQCATCSVETLPSLPAKRKKYHNFNGLKYLFVDRIIPDKPQPLHNPPRKFCVSFGGTDPAGLSGIIIPSLEDVSEAVVYVKGPGNSFLPQPYKGLGCVEAPSSIHKYIGEADVVFTSFGMTLMEALALSRPVIVVNPTTYHDELTRSFGYPWMIERSFLESRQINKDEIDGEVNRLLTAMTEEGVFDEPFRFQNAEIGSGLTEFTKFIVDWQPTLAVCPYCCEVHHKPVYRNKRLNLFHCRSCGIMFSQLFYKEEKQYNNSYFLDEYRTQYGKTYEEDRETIRSFAGERLDIIKKYVEKGTLLDFGSALGFFAEYANENGFQTLSVDVSKFAVDYIKNNLNLAAVCSDEKYLETSKDRYDVITSFYVIEHIKDFEKFIFQCAHHLTEGGVLALATPNMQGVTIRKNFHHYVTIHPEDHYRIYSPAFMKKLLKQYGFHRISIRITGIHPERFFSRETLENNILFKNRVTGRFLRKCIRFFARLFQYGDTFEIYAAKK